MSQPPDYFTEGRGVDKGCAWLAALLGRSVTCLECPLPRCLYDLTPDEYRDMEARLRLIGGFVTNEELAHRLQTVG